MSSQELSGDSTQHDQSEHEQNCDIQKDGQGGHNGSYQGRHVWNLINGSEWTEDTNNLNGLNTATSHELAGPTKDNDGEIHLYVNSVLDNLNHEVYLPYSKNLWDKNVLSWRIP